MTDPRLAIEAGAASLRRAMNVVKAAQDKGEIEKSEQFPDLHLVDQAPGWLLFDERNRFAPDVLLQTLSDNDSVIKIDSDSRIPLYVRYPHKRPTVYNFVNAVAMADEPAYNPHQFQVVVYESGVFDEKPALIVGVTSANELAFLSKLPKKSLDSYIRDAAQRSLAEIAQSPFGNEILEKDPLEGFQDWMWVIGGILAAFGLGAVGMHKRRRSLAAILLAATMALTTSSRSNANTMPIPIAITHIASAVQDPQSPEKEATFALPNFSFLENLKGLVESARGIWRTKKAQNKFSFS
jgi:hypothetical protein